MPSLPDSGSVGRLSAIIGGPTGAGAGVGAGVGSAIGMPWLGGAVGAVAPHFAGRAALTDLGCKYLANQIKSGSGLNRQGVAAVVQALIANMARQQEQSK